MAVSLVHAHRWENTMECVDIVVPTLRPRSQLGALLAEIAANTPEAHRVTCTCRPVSASKNRNLGLSVCVSSKIVMIDDDMRGFFPGWLTVLWHALTDDVAMVAARLLKPNGEPSFMLGKNYNFAPITVDMPDKELPTAAIAIHNTPLQFDENFVGSGFEDNDYCRQLSATYPDRRFLIANRCMLVHLHERKNQLGQTWKINQAYYKKKWGIQ